MKTHCAGKSARLVGPMLAILAMLFLSTPALASDGTAYTYTVSLEGTWSRTQDAYLPGSIFLRDAGLNLPEDVCISGNRIYIADSGNGRVLVFDRESGETSVIQDGLFKKPTGLFVDGQGRLLVADFGQETVFVLERVDSEKEPVGTDTGAEGVIPEEAGWTLSQRLTKPDSVLYGADRPYKPRKVMTDGYGNIYVVSEGSYEGMLLFNAAGEFVGYFGSNQASMTLAEKIQELLFTQEQRESLFNRIPLTIYNGCPGSDGLIYTVTQNDPQNSVKANNMNGSNVLTNQGELMDETDFVDVALSTQGQIYALTESGLIYEYDPDGNLVFSFGGQSLTTERSGLSSVASAIEVDSNNTVYVLDKERGLLQSFYPTAYASDTHAALLALEEGRYEESSVMWQALMRKNGMARIAQDGFARSQLLMGNYETALEHFRLSNNQEEYSSAFWELRNRWMLQNFRYVFIGLLLAVAALTGLFFLNKKFRWAEPIRETWRRQRSRPGLLRELLFVKYMIRHPVDGFYELKKGREGSPLAATILLALTFIVFLADTLFSGFIFRTADPKNTPLLSLVVLFVGAVGLFVVGNTLVSSVGSGEGRLKQVYVMTAYSLSAYVVCTPILFLLSYVLTLNEVFILSMGSGAVLTYCAVTLILGIRETHNFEGRYVVKNIFLTLFFMAMAVVAAAILYLLWDQIAEFIKMLISEVIYSVRK